MRRQIQKRLLIELKHIYQDIRPESNQELINNLRTIESIFRDEFSEVRYKFYSELLDGIILAVSQFSQPIDDATRSEMFNLSRDLLKYVFNELIKEQEIQKDIVFLPYKASMWDSLESIWRAAYEDKEHCNAYVIPIPYADRKPDQTVAAWHCEADQYPDYVPVLDYRKVNLEEMHPDIIFIHNPYDNCNALTSVDSQYYSEELKKCTDKLVYVPYFVAQDVKPGDFDREENISHLITTPGVLNADLVVVQSENIRQVYINVLMRYTTQQDRKYWEERIVGLGSPKYDKILATTKKDVHVPKSWLKMIQKPDKTWKKIVFFNTGVSIVLKLKEKALDKIESNFKIFKENKDEVVLLWRPHPLMMATMAGMLPELQERYAEIVKKYKEENWGIYDDTADLNRAVALSDAYFGDGSSVLKLYVVTGNPIMYHYMLNSGQLTDSFKISNACYEGNRIWCTMFHDPNLYQIDLDSKELKVVTNILDEEDEVHSFIKILTYNDVLIFIQSTTNLLILMDRNTFHKERYKIPSTNKITPKLSQRFANWITYKDNLYIFGFDYNGIVKFNLKTRQLEIIDDFIKDLQVSNFNEEFCIYDYVQVDNKLFMPMINANAVLKFDMNNDTTEVHYVGDEKQRYMSGTYDGENIWLAPRDASLGDIVRWNPKTNEIKQFKDYLDENKRNAKYIFGDIFNIGNYIVMMSLQAIDSNLKINIDTEEITSFKDIFDARIYAGDKYACLHLADGNIFYIDGLNLVKYDFESDKAEKIPLKPSEEVLENIKQREKDRLKYIFSPRKDGLSATFSERPRLNVTHLIEFLKSV